MMQTNNVYNRHAKLWGFPIMPCSGDKYPPLDEIAGMYKKKEEDDMPCYTETPAEMARNAERAAQKRMAEEKAKQLRGWLEEQVPEMKELDETGKLCHLIRSLGEKEFLEIIQSNFSKSEARQLAGWWEDHKFDDIQKGREV